MIEHATPKRIIARVRHHGGEKLEKFSALMKEILVPRPRVQFLETRVRLSNKNGTFTMKGYRKQGVGYVGIELKKLRGQSVRLVIE